MVRFGVSEEEENKIEMAGRNEKKMEAIRKNLHTEEDGIKNQIKSYKVTFFKISLLVES